MSALSNLNNKYFLKEHYDNPIIMSKEDAEIKYKGKSIIVLEDDYGDGLLRIVVEFKSSDEIPEDFPMEYYDNLTDADSLRYSLLSFT